MGSGSPPLSVMNVIAFQTHEPLGDWNKLRKSTWFPDELAKTFRMALAAQLARSPPLHQALGPFQNDLMKGAMVWRYSRF